MFRAFVPKEYRSLLEYVSPQAFRVIDWKKAAKDFTVFTAASFRSKNRQKIINQNQRRLSKDTKFGSVQRQTSLNEDEKTALSYSILDIYFTQFFFEEGCFIDLRLNRFHFNQNQTIWDPGSGFVCFDESFKLGMLEIYQGYYMDLPKKMEAGMLKVGLIKNTESQEVEKISTLLFSHFGDAKNTPMKFRLQNFRKSFHDIFLHLKKNNQTLPSDFLFFGFYLTTLYVSLSSLGQAVDVKKCFENVWERNQIA